MNDWYVHVVRGCHAGPRSVRGTPCLHIHNDPVVQLSETTPVIFFPAVCFSCPFHFIGRIMALFDRPTKSPVVAVKVITSITSGTLKVASHLSVTCQFHISAVRSVRRISVNASISNTRDDVSVSDTARTAVTRN
jgi:hypothetical protein